MVSSLFRMWATLDEAILNDQICRISDGRPLPDFPWESTSESVRMAWETLTEPANLAALEEWGKGRESFNDFARVCSQRAIEDCRSRAVSRD